MDLNKYIGEKIKSYRDSQGMTQAQLAEKLSTTRQTVSRYEAGDRKTTQDVLFELSKIFHVSIDSFFPEKESSDTVQTVAAHIDDDTPEDEREQIINFIENLKRARPKGDD